MPTTSLACCHQKRVPPHPFVTWVWSPWDAGSPHFETKNCSFILTLKPHQRPFWVGAQEMITTPGVASGPRISPGGLAAAAAALYLPLVILFFTYVQSTPPRRGLRTPLAWSVPLPSIPIAQQPCPSPASQLGQREPIVPMRTGPCPAAHLRDGHLMPVSPPPVPILSHPSTLGWGAASTYWLEETTAQPSPLLSGILCPHLSVCLS